MLYVILAAGLYLMVIFAMMDTKDFRSFFLFRFIPLCLGSVLIVYSLLHLDFLKAMVA